MGGSFQTLEACTTVKVVINISTSDVTGCVASDTARTVRDTIGTRKVSSHFVREAINEMISAIQVIIFGIII